MKNRIGPIKKKVAKKSEPAKPPFVNIHPSRKTLVVCNIWEAVVKLSGQIESIKGRLDALEEAKNGNVL